MLIDKSVGGDQNGVQNKKIIFEFISGEEKNLTMLRTAYFLHFVFIGMDFVPPPNFFALTLGKK